MLGRFFAVARNPLQSATCGVNKSLSWVVPWQKKSHYTQNTTMSGKVK